MLTVSEWAWLLAAGLFAGAQNALAGGGSFITLTALLLTGIDPRAANVTSTVALFPSQALSGWAGRELVADLPRLSFRALCTLAVAGGLVGAVLLLVTPGAFFARLVPWLVLFATGVFAWGSYVRKPGAATPLSPAVSVAAAFAIAVYGGYFGGGIGFMLIAVLTSAGLALRSAGATKNALAGVINLGAVVVFLVSGEMHWAAAAALCAGSIAGGFGGVWALKRVPERLLRGGVVVLGLLLTVGLFLR